MAVLGVCALAAQAAVHPLLGKEAPDFALRAFAGSNVRLSEHQGDVVVLSFWASRCGTCRAQLASLNLTFETYRSAGLQILAINVDDDPERALDAARSHPVAFPLLLDPEKAVSRRYLIDALPTTVLIDRNGIVRHVHRDYDSRSDALYVQQLRELLNE